MTTKIRRFECVKDPEYWWEYSEALTMWRANHDNSWHFASHDPDTFVSMFSGYKEVAYSGFDPNDIQSGSKPCCGGGIGTTATYSGGQWHDKDCNALRPSPPTGVSASPYAWVPSSPQKVCECGADAVYGPGNGLHSATMPCPLYKKII